MESKGWSIPSDHSKETALDQTAPSELWLDSLKWNGNKRRNILCWMGKKSFIFQKATMYITRNVPTSENPVVTVKRGFPAPYYFQKSNLL